MWPLGLTSALPLLIGAGARACWLPLPHGLGPHASPLSLLPTEWGAVVVRHARLTCWLSHCPPPPTAHLPSCVDAARAI